VPPAPSSLPYALTSLHFPFPALVALAARLPLGGGREVALAALQMARLTHDAAPVALRATPPLGAAEREVRAAAARVWLASLALPTPVRNACIRCADASAGPAEGIAPALRAVLQATGAQLDAAAVRELEQLVRALSPVAGVP
jgi:hypothetical protein